VLAGKRKTLPDLEKAISKLLARKEDVKEMERDVDNFGLLLREATKSYISVWMLMDQSR
jgi:hypothetical protein